MEQGVISFKDLKFYAHHGCLPEEEIIGGNYLVDLNIFTDYSEAARQDDLTLTIDYCDIYKIVKLQMEIRSKLIENVAYRIANALKNGLRKIDRVEVKVTKISPPVNGDVNAVSVSVFL